MSRTIKHVSLLIVFLILMLFLSSCNSVPGFAIAPGQSTKETDLYSESVAIRNCADYENDKVTSITEASPIVVSVEIAEKAYSEETGDSLEISQDLREKLENQIKKEFESVYDEIKAEADKTDLVIPAYKIRVFDVMWKQLCNCSTVAFELKQEVFTANFSYKVDYPTVQNYSTMGCTA